MIAKIALFLVGAALTVPAQTNFDVLVCKNASYTNATIIRATLAYLVVTHNDGIAKVALTNLPSSLQQKYKYDPAKATAALAAFAVELNLYSSTLGAPFVFDDFVLPFQQGSPHLLAWVSGVRPFLMLTYWLNARMSGGSPLGYHLLNLIIHAANTGLVFLVL